MPLGTGRTPTTTSGVAHASASNSVAIVPATMSSRRYRSAWPYAPRIRSARLEPSSEIGPLPSRYRWVAVSGSCVHAAAADDTAHGSVFDTAPITASRSTPSPRISAAVSPSAASAIAVTMYGAASGDHAKPTRRLYRGADRDG